jgi:CubicO group peptidase (beta-lactamase class C family)
MGKLPLDYQPGEAWSYSNTNYALLGWIMEEVTKEPYTKFIEENVLRPAGMTHTVFMEGGVDVPGLAKGYSMRRRAPNPISREAASIKSDGGLVTNIPDMLKWDEVLTSMRLLKRKSYAFLWSRGLLNSGRTHAYGMGWYVNISGHNASMSHGGNSAGYSAGIVRYPRLKLSVIFLANLDPLPGEAMARQISELIEPSLKSSPFVAATDPDPKRTDQIKFAIGALAANKPDESLLEPETFAPMKSARAKAMGAGTWRNVKTIDQMTFGAAKPQGSDTFLTYRITSGPRSYIASILWSPKNKIVEATISQEEPPAAAPAEGHVGK